MTSITIHGLEDPLDRLIREKARRQGISLNKAIKQLLAESLGLAHNNPSPAVDFSDLSGVWSEEDIQEFNNNTQELSDINLSDWK